MGGSIAVEHVARPAPAVDTHRLIVTGSVARLVALTGQAGVVALMWPLTVLLPEQPAVAASAVIVLACALVARLALPGLGVVAALASWSTAWLSLRLLIGNGMLTYWFATEGSEITCHDIPCPTWPAPLYVSVFGACAIAGLIDVGCSAAAMVRVTRGVASTATRVAAGVGLVVSGALMLLIAGVITWYW